MATRMLRFVMAFALALTCVGAFAQAWPQRAIKVIVPSTPGSSPDVLARMLGQLLKAPLGQSIVVDNRPGAGGILATDTLAKAAPDGYTLEIAHDGNMAINTILYKSLPYDPQKDFAPVAKLALNELILIAAPSTGVRTFAEFVAFVKARGGEATYASAGIGSPNHVFMEELLQKIGGTMLHVPYKGGAAGVTGLLGNQSQFMLAGIAPALGHVKSGKLLAVAALQSKRASILPDVPTLGESIPGFALETWFGLFAPAGTPPAIVGKLGSAVKDILARPDFREKMAQQGMAVQYETGDVLMKQIRRDIAHYGELAKKIKLEAN